MNPACAQCGDPVDVPCFNGARLRCGCGKTQIDSPAGTPRTVTPDHVANLAAYVSIMRTRGIAKLRSPDGWVLELTNPAPAHVVPPTANMTPMPDAPDESCTCGHALHAHTDVGCTYGCDLDTCGLSSEAKAEATE